MWPWAMTLTLDFEGQIKKKSSIIGIRGWIDMEPKGYESIGCWTYIVTLNFDLSQDFQGQIFNSHILRTGRSIDL